MIEAASQEGRRGVGWGLDRLVVVGRKPGVQAGVGTVALPNCEGAGRKGEMDGKESGKMQRDGGKDAAPITAAVSEEDETEPAKSEQQTSSGPVPDPVPAPTSGEEAQAKGKGRRASLLRMWRRMSGSSSS